MTARKSPSTRVTVKIDRALRRKWNEAMAVVRRTARAAGRALRRAEQRTPPRDSPVVRAIVAAFRAAPLRDVRVRLAAGKLSFSAVPLAVLADFARALAAAKLSPATP